MKTLFEDKSFTKFFIWCLIGFILMLVGISDVFAVGNNNLNYTIQKYYVRTMSRGDSTQVGSYIYTTNPFLTNNISENGWLPRLIGFDGIAGSNFNSSYVYTLTYRFNYPSSTDVFDWKTYMNYASFKIYGSTPDLFSCSIINNTSSYTDVKCTFKRSTTDNYFFFYFDFFDNYNAINTYGIPYNFGTFQLSFSNISLTWSQDTGEIQVEQNNIIINQNNETNKKLDETNNQLGNLNDSLNNDDISAATTEASNFFSGFETNTFGLTSVITSPLQLIGSITSSSCSPLSLTIPFLENNNKLELPCMSTIYSNYFGTFFTIYQTITFGIVAYWVCIKIFNLVKDFKNPDHDEIEVLDL